MALLVFPANPSNGQEWWHSGEGRLYIYYTDGSSNQWVAATPEAEVDQFWQRTGTTISPKTAGDAISTTGALTAGSLVGRVTTPAAGQVGEVLHHEQTFTGNTLFTQGVNTTLTLTTPFVVPAGVWKVEGTLLLRSGNAFTANPLAGDNISYQFGSITRTGTANEISVTSMPEPNTCASGFVGIVDYVSLKLGLHVVNSGPVNYTAALIAGNGTLANGTPYASWRVGEITARLSATRIA